MITDLLRMTAGEWFKQRRRWLPWILLGVLVLISQAFLWGFWAVYNLSETPVPGHLDYFVLPGSIHKGVDVLFGSRLIVLMAMVLAASSLGTEYGWGTLRTALTKGVGRPQILLAKFAIGVTLGAVWLLIVAVTVSLASLLGVALSPEVGSSPTGWPDAVIVLAKAAFALVPYVVLGTFFVVLTQSTAQGISLSVVFFVVEGLTLPPLLTLSDRLEPLGAALLIQNIDGLLAPTGQHTAQELAVILAYTVVLAGATLWLFLRRDIGGPRGE